MPASVGMGMTYPGQTENQPLSYAQQYGAAAIPPSAVYNNGYQAAANPTAPGATIGVGVQSPYQPTAYQAPSAQPGQGSAYGPNIIGNNLPWQGGGNMMSALSSDPATMLNALGPAYAKDYASALNFSMNQANNINAGYQQTAQNQFAGQQATQAGYGNLSNAVLGGIAGIGSDQLALINRNYAGQAGSADQNLINSGLGNSTVRSSVQRGIGLDQSLAQNNLANSIAQTKAGYQSNIGLAGLNYQGQSVRDNTGLAENQLNWMNSITAKYPDAGQYTNLAMQAGAAQQSNLNRAQIDRLAAGNSDLAAQVRQAAVLGGSGGVQPGTGGRLPTSAINYTGSQGSPGMGTSGSAQGSFGSSGYSAPAGAGGGGAMQQALASKGGFGSGLASAPGVTDYAAQGGNAGAAAAGFPSVVGNANQAATDFNNQFNQQRAALGLPPVAVGQEAATVAAESGGGGAMGAGGGSNYDPYSNPFGFGAPDSSYPSYDQQPGAADAAYGFGTGAFAGSDMFGYGGDVQDSTMSGDLSMGEGEYYYG